MGVLHVSCNKKLLLTRHVSYYSFFLFSSHLKGLVKISEDLFSRLTGFAPFKRFITEINDTFWEAQFSLTSSEIKKPHIVVTGNPRDIYLFKCNNNNIRKTLEICTKVTLKTPKGNFIFIVKFEHIPDFFVVFLMLTSNR